jgi:hypothetical protein
MAIRIDDLTPTVLPSRDHVVPAMKEGLTVKLTLGQILDLFVEGAPEALNTWLELVEKLADDDDALAAIVAALDKRLRVDGAQTFTPIEKAQGLSNLVGGPVSGFRNKLINPRFSINQPAAPASATLAANAHWYDGWKAGSGGCTLSENNGVVTITAGTIVQIIEGADIEAGTHVINWTGTASCAVDGVAKARGDTFTLTRGTNCAVSFGAGTLSFTQVEPGDTPTPFEQRPRSMEMDICQWRYEHSFVTISYYQSVSGEPHSCTAYYREKRDTPVVTDIQIVSNVNVSSAGYDQIRKNSARLSVAGGAGGAASISYVAVLALDARL